MVPAPEDRTGELQEVHEEIKTMIKIVGDHAKKNYDHNVQIQPKLKVGDKVLLRHDHIAH